MFKEVSKNLTKGHDILSDDQILNTIQNECKDMLKKISSINLLKPIRSEQIAEVASMRKMYDIDRESLEKEFTIRRAVLMRAYIKRELGIYQDKPDKSIIGVKGELKNIKM